MDIGTGSGLPAERKPYLRTVHDGEAMEKTVTASVRSGSVGKERTEEVRSC
jgi:hypothetical protein